MAKVTEGSPLNHRTSMVRIELLVVDPRVQRDLDVGRVKRIQAKFDPDALGVITVSRRADGVLHIVDGQHRIAAAKAAGHGNRTVECHVYDGLTLREEAELFRKLNDTRRPTSLILHKVAVIEGDPVACGIEKIVTNSGLLVASNGPSSFAAVATLRRIYLVNEKAAEQAIHTLVRAWGPDRYAVAAQLVEGIGWLFHRYGEDVDAEHLRMALAREPGGPVAMVGRARGAAQMRAVNVGTAMSDLMVNIYNRNKRKGQIPPWQQ